MLTPQDRIEIIDLYATYNLAIDSGHAAEYAQTFTPEGIFVRTNVTYRGRLELRQFVEERSQSLRQSDIPFQQHWNSNLYIDGGSDGDRAMGGCYLLLVGRRKDLGDLVVVAVGHYEDELRRIDQKWLFSCRRVVVA